MKKILVLFLVAAFIAAFFVIAQRNTKAQENTGASSDKSMIDKLLGNDKKEKKVGLVAQDVLKAKQAGVPFERRDLFQADTNRAVEDSSLRELIVDGTVFELERTGIQQILKNDVNFMTIRVPGESGTEVELELMKSNIFDAGFSVKTSASSAPVSARDLGVHYQGMIKGDPYSLAAISVTNNEVSGFFYSEGKGNNVIGRMGGSNPTNKQVVYKVSDMLVRPTADQYCSVKEEGGPMTPPSPLIDEPDAAPQATCVRIFMEANYDLFQNKGSVVNTANYIAGFFNQSATIYRNDGIFISISEMFVWNSPSPYTNTSSSSAVLTQYRATRTTFNGTLAHLLTLANYGGIAYLNVICNTTSKHGVNGIDETYQNLPTYSWTVDVFTHELGHNLGSQHTHSCSWNGNNTAIDSCGPTAGYPNEGNCEVVGLPAPGQGTIMSYCHLVSSIGKNLALGFGDQPKARIQQRIAAGTCLGDCGSTTTLNLTSAGYNISEAGGSVTVLVTRQGSAAGVTVNYQTSNGTAIAPQDYTAVSGTLTFAANETIKSISIPIVDDTVFDPNETINVVLTGPSGATLGTPTTAVVTIADNDPFVPSNPTPFDYDGDGKADVSVFRPSTGVWYVNRSSGGNFIGQFGANGDMTVPADYDGDDKTDVAIWRPSNGTWFWLNSTNSTVGGNQFGTNGDRPVPGDFDGDNKADIAIFRPASGTWWRINSGNGAVSATQFGISEDKPNVADFDGDNRSDLSVYRPSNGSWYRLNSSNGAFVVFNFGTSEDKPVPADYDGDGKSDVALWRPSTGAWYWVNSANGTVSGNTFGLSTDMPVPADYDGDGKTDLAVFRPSQGMWYLLRTTEGLGGVTYGANGDFPAPNSFIQ